MYRTRRRKLDLYPVLRAETIAKPEILIIIKKGLRKRLRELLNIKYIIINNIIKKLKAQLKKLKYLLVTTYYVLAIILNKIITRIKNSAI